MYSEANSPQFHDIVPKEVVLERVSHALHRPTGLMNPGASGGRRMV